MSGLRMHTVQLPSSRVTMGVEEDEVVLRLQGRACLCVGGAEEGGDNRSNSRRRSEKVFGAQWDCHGWLQHITLLSIRCVQRQGQTLG